MISKAKSIRGSSAGIDYIMKEEKNAYELCRNDVIGTNGKEILSEFRETQSLNSTCKNNTISIVLSPSNDQVHNAKELRKYTEKHVENLGLKDHQYIAYVHQNTQATHIHIIANRIDYTGKSLNDSYLGFKAQHSAESIAQEYGLTTAKEVRKERKFELSQTQNINSDLKAEIYHKHNIAVKKSSTFQAYMQNMQKQGLKIEPTINKGGKLQGFRIYDKSHDISFKASEISRNCSLSNMIKKGVSFDKLSIHNLAIDKKFSPAITKSLLTKGVSLTRPLLKVAKMSLKLASQEQDTGM